MEASVAGGQAQGDGGNANGGGESGGQPDLAAIAEQFQGTREGQEQLREQLTQVQELLQSNPWQQAEAEQDGQQEEVDLSFLDATDPDFDPAQFADKFGALIKAGVDAEVAPLRTELAEVKQERTFEHLAAELPVLQDPETAKEIAEATVKLAEEMGMPELAHNAHMWKLVTLASQAAQLANEEGADAPRAAHLEGGGGAAPAGSQVDPLGPMFEQAQGGSKVLPF